MAFVVVHETSIRGPERSGAYQWLRITTRRRASSLSQKKRSRGRRNFPWIIACHIMHIGQDRNPGLDEPVARKRHSNGASSCI